MKKIIITLLCLLPTLVSAQSLTSTQKQEALDAATRFCSLLTRYCYGDRITLMQQINDLCISGDGCSAYEEVKENKEMKLRNFLITIQRYYPEKLVTEISAPSLSNCQIYEEPILSFSMDWGKASGGGDVSTNVLGSLNKDGIENFYIVFDVTQKFPTLGKSTQKKIIYDVNSKKIAAFITHKGSNISFLNGLVAYSKKDYAEAAKLFEYAATNDAANRYSFKKTNWGLAMCSYMMCGNYDKTVECVDKFGDSFYSAFIHLTYEMATGNYPESNKYAKLLEKELAKQNNIANISIANAYLQLANFYVSPIVGTYQDVKKAVRFLRKADALDYPTVGYMLFVYSTRDVFTDDVITFDEILNSLFKSARLGYPPSWFWVGSIEENKGNSASAISWFEKSAGAGNPVAMARLGRLLNSNGNKEDARKWLQKALEGNKLEAQLEDFANSTGKPNWPNDRSDVQTLLNSIRTTNSTSSNYNSSTSSNSSSYNSYSSNYHSRKKFNEPKDERGGGLSIGYVQKQWVYDYEDGKEKYGMFDDKDYVPGIQVGMRLSPQFGYGFALNSGLFYEYYFSTSESYYDDYGEYHGVSKEHSLYLPFHLKYDLNFSKWFQVSFYGGVGLDYGLKGKIYLKADGETDDSYSMYDKEYDIKRFNASLEYGAAIRINHVRLDISTSKGLINMSGDRDYTVKQNKMFNICLSYIY